MIINKKTTEIYGSFIVVTAEFHKFDYELVKQMAISECERAEDMEKLESHSGIFDEIKTRDSDYKTCGWLNDVEKDGIKEVFHSMYNVPIVLIMCEAKAYIIIDMSWFISCYHAGFDLNIL